MMKTLTVFTPTYNRAHTLKRLYESLCTQTCDDFEWLVIDDGSTDFTKELIDGFIRQNRLPIRYIYKENGGLHTGYNTAYDNITTELNVCIDSDDFMPEDAVEIIINTWREKGNDKYLGLIGLDFSYQTMEPIGRYFPEGLHECYFPELRLKKLHFGDTKLAFRTDLMKTVFPQIGFHDEKYFNPIYSILKISDRYPLIVINKSLCIVDYQPTTDSMSKNIFRQYVNSPKSFAKHRLLEMTLEHNSLINKLRSHVHYVAECRIGNLKDCLKNSPQKFLTLISFLPGIILSKYIIHKVKHNQ